MIAINQKRCRWSRAESFYHGQLAAVVVGGLGQVMVVRLVEEEEQRRLISTDQEGRTPMPMGDGRGFSPAPCPAGGSAQRVPCSAGG